MPTSVINLTDGEVENTHTVKNKDEIMIIGTGTHIVLLFDENTKFSRILKARDMFLKYALSVKAVDSGFKNQYLLKHKEWANK